MSVTGKEILLRLDKLQARGARHLRRWAVRGALEKMLPTAALVSVIAASVCLVLEISDWLRWTQIAISPIFVLLLIAGLPVLLLAVVGLRSWLACDIDRQVCLAVFDQGLLLEDRLQVADEFLALQDPGAFEQAAIADVVRVLETAENSGLPELEIRALSVPIAAIQRFGVAAGLVVLTFLASNLSGFSSADIPGDAGVAGQPSEVADLGRTEGMQDFERENAQGQGSDKEPPKAPENATQQEEVSPENSAEPYSAGGSSGQNKGSSSSSNASVGAGAASGAAKSEQPREPENTVKQTRKSASSSKRQAAGKQDADSASGVRGGQGRAGSSASSSMDGDAPKNPAGHEDEADVEGDAEEEEDETQEAEGVGKPQISRKKSPVDRQLIVGGQGDEQDESANGRSGASGMKKTRGVGAMLLGVPMPDRLQGTPNPGRSKSRQEGAPPQSQSASTDQAGLRTGPNGSAGSLPHPDVPPWLQTVIRKYFHTRRGVQDTDEIKTEESEQGS